MSRVNSWLKILGQRDNKKELTEENRDKPEVTEVKPEEETEEKEVKETKKEAEKEEEADKEEIDTPWSMYSNPETLPILIKHNTKIKIYSSFWANHKLGLINFSILFDSAWWI